MQVTSIQAKATFTENHKAFPENTSFVIKAIKSYNRSLDLRVCTLHMFAIIAIVYLPKYNSKAIKKQSTDNTLYTEMSI